MKKYGSKKIPKSDNAEEAKGEEDKDAKANIEQFTLREKIVNAKVEVPQNCTTCGSNLMVGGPIWNAEIHNYDFARRLLDKINLKDCKLMTKSRIKGVLGGILDEEVC